MFFENDTIRRSFRCRQKTEKSLQEIAGILPVSAKNKALLDKKSENFADKHSLRFAGKKIHPNRPLDFAVRLNFAWNHNTSPFGEEGHMIVTDTESFSEKVQIRKQQVYKRVHLSELTGMSSRFMFNLRNCKPTIESVKVIYIVDCFGWSVR